MGKLVLQIVFFFISLSVWTQENLVPNGSFEEYDWCPNSLNGYYIDACKYWNTPTLGTSDYFNSCSTEIGSDGYEAYGVPQNYIGNQSAHSGNAYAGLVFVQVGDTTTPYVEYIQVKLKSKLTQNKLYKLRFFVHNSRILCFNSIGALFTSSQLNMNINETLPFIPNFQSDLQMFFCDTNIWYPLEYTFSSNGTEEFLTIGVFTKMFDTKISDYNGNILSGPDIENEVTGYLYVDDVSIMETSLEIPNIFTPNKDGVNDNYTLDLKGLGAKKAEIYNRWGNKIIEGEYSINWDGTFNGKDCSEGVYFIRIEFEDNIVSGFIHLMK